MKTDLRPAKQSFGSKKIFEQPSRFFSYKHEWSVRKTQSQIFQARFKGETSLLHALQNCLCESFCAKLLATDYAINSVQINYVSENQPPFLLARDQEVQSYLKAVPQSWRVDIAQSLWLDKKLCNAHLRCPTKKSFGIDTQNLSFLEQSLKEKIREVAQQVHALLALEPEWQAVFVLQENQAAQNERLIAASCSQTAFSTKKLFLWESKIKLQERSCNPAKYGIKDVEGFKKSIRSQVCFSKQDFGTTEFSQNKVFAQKRVITPKLVIEKVKKNCSGPSLKYVLVGSIKDCLNSIDHRVLMKKLGTFPAMQKQICALYKTKILETKPIALSCIQNSTFKKESMCLTDDMLLTKAPLCKKTEYMQKNKVFLQSTYSVVKEQSFDNPGEVFDKDANFWRTSISRQRSKTVNRALQQGLSRFSTQHFLYSVFPETLWKKCDRSYDVMQIESKSKVKTNILAAFFTRVLVHGLQERMQQCAKKVISPYSRYNAFCLRQNNNLGFFSYRHDLIPKKSKKQSKRGAFLASCSGNKRQPPFFCGYGHRFVILHPDKKVLEMCISQAKTYLSEVGCACFESSDKKEQSADLSKDKVTHNVDDDCFSLKYRDYSESKSKYNFKEYPLFKIQDCRQGFLFLGFQVIQIKQRDSYVCKVTPSRKSTKSLLLLLRNQIKQNQSASTTVLITRLNALLVQWVEYYKHCEYKHSYNQILYLIWEKTRSWLSRR